MIVDRYLIKEVIVTLLGVSLVLLLIALSAQLVDVFSKVASGALRTDTVFTMLGLKSISMMVFIIPLSLYLGVLLAFSRLYKDSEMVVLAACGIGNIRALRAVLGLAFIFMLIQGFFTLALAPWAEQRVQTIKAEIEAASDVKGLVPGRFKEIRAGTGVIYVQNANEDRTQIENLFIQQYENNKPAIITSQSGFQMIDEKTGDKFIVLTNGKRYEGRPGYKDFAMINFEQHGVRVNQKLVNVLRLKHRSTPTMALLASDKPGDKAEFQGRVSSAIVCVLLTIFAVPLSRTSARQGRYGKLAIALLIYITYTNLLNVAQAWVTKGDVTPEFGVWWVHILMFVVSIFLLLRQTGIKHLLFRQAGTS